jgi:hypothetical protein
MSLKKFLTFSVIICSIFLVYLGSFGLEKPFWQKLFLAFQKFQNLDAQHTFDWAIGLSTMGYLLLGSNIGLYFFGKNLSRRLYLGIFALLLLLSLLVSTWIITK